MAKSTTGTIIDVGCGTAPYRELFSHATYIGVETVRGSRFGSAKTGADVLYDGKSLPFANESVDNILCNQVLEHVFEPIAFLRELHRVLRPGGRLMLTVPFAWDEHEQPHDYARYSSFGLRYLLGKCGFEVIEARRTLADASILAQLSLAYVFKVVRRRGDAPGFAGKLFLALTSIPVNIVGIALARVSPSNQDLYLDNAMTLARLPGEVADERR